MRIAVSEVICVGDADNDRHMLEYAGLSVAMGNADDDIKAQADHVTASNVEDGVARVIERFILAEELGWKLDENSLKAGRQ